MQQAHIRYSGAVQGVGFRFTALQIGKELDLTGWVKNLVDGSVEMVVEGEKKAIETFCEKIEERFQGYIDNKNIVYQDTQEQFHDFRIQY